MAHCFFSLLAAVGAALCFGVFGQTSPPLAASLDGVSGCALDGNDVFISVGQGAAQRRYKYPWEASIDALCNAKGFAIASPAKSGALATTAVGTAPAVSRPATPSGAGFPDGSRPFEAAELTQLLSGRVFKIIAKAGPAGRLQLNQGGQAFFNGGGFNLAGSWRVEGSSICYAWRTSGAPDGCNEMRLVGTQVYAKRLSGEVVQLDAGN